jgi:hypothetical protein
LLAWLSFMLRFDIAEVGRVRHGALESDRQTITMAINRHGRLNPTCLPRCHYHQIQLCHSSPSLCVSWGTRGRLSFPLSQGRAVPGATHHAALTR